MQNYEDFYNHVKVNKKGHEKNNHKKSVSNFKLAFSKKTNEKRKTSTVNKSKKNFDYNKYYSSAPKIKTRNIFMIQSGIILLVLLIFVFAIIIPNDRRQEAMFQKLKYEQELEYKRLKEEENKRKRITQPVIVPLIQNQPVVEEQPKVSVPEPEPVKQYDEAQELHYETIGRVSVPEINIDYPIISETSDDLLKISITKFWGPNPNQVGNMVLLGHNYKSRKQFGALSDLKEGSLIKITDGFGNTVNYRVYDKKVIQKTDKDCMSQITDGKREVTLITCTNWGRDRYYVKAREE